MLGAFLNLDTKSTSVLLILALKSGFKPHVSNFGFIWSFGPPCMSKNRGANVLCRSYFVSCACCLQFRIHRWLDDLFMGW